MNERDGLKRAVDRLLKTYLCTEVWLEKRSPAPGSRSGVSDYVGIAYGKPLAIELKHPTKPTPRRKDQVEYQHRFNRAGGVAFVACSVDEVRVHLEDLHRAILVREEMVEEWRRAWEKDRARTVIGR
jgi:Holliday junction resolvase